MVKSRALYHEFHTKGRQLFMERHSKAHTNTYQKSHTTLSNQQLYVPPYVKIEHLRFDVSVLRKVLDDDYDKHPEKYLLCDSSEAPISNPFLWHNAPCHVPSGEYSYVRNVRRSKMLDIGKLGRLILEGLLEQPAKIGTTISELTSGLSPETSTRLSELARVFIEQMFHERIIATRSEGLSLSKGSSDEQARSEGDSSQKKDQVLPYIEA